MKRMRREVDVFKYVKEVNHLMKKEGLLLVTQGSDKKVNAMTIGWGFLGTMWSRPVFIVAVRLSRHTYKLIEDSESFTVCLPAEEMSEALTVCGTMSGRDMDKLKQLGLSLEKGVKVATPYIKECPVHLECRTLYKDAMTQGRLDKKVETEMYKTGDWHVLYYGEVVGVFEETKAKEMLMK